MRGLGWIPDVEDERDQPLSEMLGAMGALDYAESSDLMVYLPEVFNQGGLGSCVAAGLAHAIRISDVRQAVQAGLPTSYALSCSRMASVLWLYYWGRAQRHETAFDVGTSVRLVLRSANMIGVPPQKVWPYSDDKSGDHPLFSKMPSKSAFRAARDQVDGYAYRRVISRSPEREIKIALSRGYPVVGGIDVSHSFVDNQFDPSRPLGPAEADIAGGHLMCIVGHDETARTFKILNSYGSKWGAAGTFLANVDFVRAMRDLTVLERTPIYSE